MKCPVCKTECNDAFVCLECGFSHVQSVFVNRDDADAWEREVIVPFRENYWLRAKPQFVIKNGVLEKYSGNNTNVVVPYGVVVIGENAFSGNDFLETVSLPSSVREIQKFAFSCCDSLAEIKMNKGLEVIRLGAFECCDLLRIALPDSVAQLDEGFCLGGAIISVNASNAAFIVVDKCLIDTRTSTLLHCWSDDDKIHIPNGVKHIGRWSFPLINNEYRRIYLPEGVESIDYLGRGIACVSIPDTVKTILGGALSEVSRVHVSKKNRTYYCEGGCVIEKQTHTIITVRNKDMERCVIPENARKIGKYAFSYCQSLRQIVIPASIIHIDYGAFFHCNNLEAIYFEHDSADPTWHAFWNIGLDAKLYWKSTRHYEPVPNEEM